MHNSYLNYVKHILPRKMPNHLIEAGSATGKFRCCPVLSKIWNSEIFDPADLKDKWRIIVKSLTQIDGIPYTPREIRPRPTNQLQATQPVPPGHRIVVREYEPAPINRQREEKRESVIRRNLHNFFTKMDDELKTLYEPNKFDWPVQKSTGITNRWTFTDSSDEPPAKKQKSDIVSEPDSISSPSISSSSSSVPNKKELSDSDTCVICMERARTHAFLHYGLAGQDVTSHFVACRECANSCRWADQGCPCCRTPVINVIRVLK